MAEKKPKDYMKDMLPAQKVAYFWQYYKWLLLAGAGAVLLVALIIAQIRRSPGDYLAEVVLVNADQIETEKSDYFDKFIPESGYEEGEDYLMVDASLDVDPNDMSQTSASGYQILAAMFTAGEIDVFLSDEDVFALEAQNHAFCDLSEVLPDDLLAQYSDKLWYGKDPQTGEQIPYGVILDESRIYTDETMFVNVPVAGISSQSACLDIDIDLITYLLES